MKKETSNSIGIISFLSSMILNQGEIQCRGDTKTSGKSLKIKGIFSIENRIIVMAVCDCHHCQTTQ